MLGVALRLWGRGGAMLGVTLRLLGRGGAMPSVTLRLIEATWRMTRASAQYDFHLR